MNPLESLVERKLSGMEPTRRSKMPGGSRLGPADAAVRITLRELGPLAHIAGGEVGRVAQDYVEGSVDFDGSMRDLMLIAAQMIGDDPTQASHHGPLGWWHSGRGATARRAPQAACGRAAGPVPLRRVGRLLRAVARSEAGVFVRLLARAAHDLAQAQEAKLDHICRKLMLSPASGSSTSVPAGAACCCGRPSTTA